MQACLTEPQALIELVNTQHTGSSAVIESVFKAGEELQHLISVMKKKLKVL